MRAQQEAGDGPVFGWLQAAGRLERHGLAHKGVQVGGSGEMAERAWADQRRHRVRQLEPVRVGPVAVAAGLPAILVFGWILGAPLIGQALAAVAGARAA